LYFSGLSLRKTIREAFIIAICQKKSYINQSGIGYNIIINQPTKKVAEEENENIAIHYYR
jgi:hypothetical protein